MAVTRESETEQASTQPHRIDPDHAAGDREEVRCEKEGWRRSLTVQILILS